MATRFLALLILIGGTAAAAAASDDDLRKQIVGAWGETAECTGAVLTFNADGSFSTTDKSQANPEVHNGTYQISAGKLTGQLEQQAMPEVTLRFDGTTMYLDAQGGPTDKLARCN